MVIHLWLLAQQCKFSTSTAASEVAQGGPTGSWWSMIFFITDPARQLH